MKAVTLLFSPAVAGQYACFDFVAITIRHISSNYPIYVPRRFGIVAESLASPAFCAGAFGFRATAPALPKFKRAPSLLLSLRISQHPCSGVFLSERFGLLRLCDLWKSCVEAFGGSILVGPPALAGGAGVQSSGKAFALEVGFSPGDFQGPALKRTIREEAFCGARPD